MAEMDRQSQLHRHLKGPTTRNHEDTSLNTEQLQGCRHYQMADSSEIRQVNTCVIRAWYLQRNYTFPFVNGD